ncbi:MAG: hypothetical protein ABI967_02380 [bacterium]
MIDTKIVVGFLIIQLFLIAPRETSPVALALEDPVSVKALDGQSVAATRTAKTTPIKKMSDDSAESKRHRKQAVVTSGIWGGQHIRMDVTTTGAEIEYDCALGSIAGKLTLDAKGSFSLTGTHTVEGPGPTRIGGGQASSSVRYSGKVAGDKMTLTVTRADTSEDLGTFELKRGSEGRIRKCR